MHGDLVLVGQTVQWNVWRLLVLVGQTSSVECMETVGVIRTDYFSGMHGYCWFWKNRLVQWNVWRLLVLVGQTSSVECMETAGIGWTV